MDDLLADTHTKSQQSHYTLNLSFALPQNPVPVSSAIQLTYLHSNSTPAISTVQLIELTAGMPVYHKSRNLLHRPENLLSPGPRKCNRNVIHATCLHSGNGTPRGTINPEPQ
jgi:hypothetical protein